MSFTHKYAPKLRTITFSFNAEDCLRIDFIDARSVYIVREFESAFDKPETVRFRDKWSEPMFEFRGVVRLSVKSVFRSQLGFDYSVKLTHCVTSNNTQSCPSLRMNSNVISQMSWRTHVWRNVRRCFGRNQSKVNKPEVSMVDQGAPPVCTTTDVVSNNAFIGGFKPDTPDIVNLFEREYFLESFNISMSKPYNDVCYSRELPGYLMHRTFPFSGILATHTIIRADVRIIVKLNVTPFHSGSLMMMCAPSPLTHTTCPQDCFLLPHTMINLGYQNSACLLIEHITPLKFMYVNLPDSDDANQTFSIYVWNTLDVGANIARSIDCSVSFKFENVIVALKRPYDVIEQAKWTFDDTVGAFEDLSAGIQASVEEESFFGKISSFGSTLLKYFANAGSIVGNVLDFIGLFDSPLEFVNDMSESTTVDVPKKCITFRLNSNDVLKKSIYKSFDLCKFIRTPGRVAIASWSPSDGSGKTLWLLPLSLDIYTIDKTVRHAVPICEAARHFEYWRGDLIWTFEIIATRYHQGQLLVGWSPGKELKRDTNDEIRQVYYQTFDIGTENTFSIECPFVSRSEWRLTNDDVGGCIMVNVLNPLICPSTVAQTLSVNIYLSASDDFWFACPRNERFSIAQMLWRPIQEKTSPPKFMRDHTNIMSLLRRSSQLYHTNITLKADTWNLIALLPLVDKTAFPFATYLRRGAGRWACTSTVTKSNGVIFVSRCTFASERQRLQFPNLEYSNPHLALRGGSVFHSPNSEAMFRIEVPHYHMLDSIPNVYGTYPTVAIVHQPVIELLAYSSTNPTFDLFLRWEAADDFSLAYPLPNPTRSFSSTPLVPDMTSNSTPKPFLARDSKGSSDAFNLWKQIGGWNNTGDNAWNELTLNDSYVITGWSFHSPTISGDLNVKVSYKNHFDMDRWSLIKQVTQTSSGYFAWYLDEPIIARAVRVEIAGPGTGSTGQNKQLGKGTLYGHALEGSPSVDTVLRIRRGLEQGIFGAFSALSAIGTLWKSLQDFGSKLTNEMPASEGPFYNIMELLLVHFLAIANSLHSLAHDGNYIACMTCITACSFFITRKFNVATAPAEGRPGLYGVFWRWLGLEQGGYMTEVVKLLGNLTFLIGSVFKFSLPSEYHEYVAITAEGNDTVLHRFICFIKYFFYGKSLLDEVRTKTIDSIIEFIEEVRFNERNGCNTMNSVRTNGMQHYQDMRAKAVKFQGTAMKLKLPLTMLKELNDVILEFDAIVRNGIEPKTQPEPVGIFFYGKPGVGKSFMSSHFLSKHVLEKIGYNPGDRVDEFIYNMPVSRQRFMDGYNQQPWVTFDEFLQSSECEDALQVINLISTTSNPVNMAELKDKKMLFKSPIICCCSNAGTFHAVKGIHEIDALVRRFPVTYELTIFPDYLADGKLDVKKVVDEVAGKTSAETMAAFDRIFKFTPRAMVHGAQHAVINPGQVVSTYSQLVDEIAGLVKTRDQNFKLTRGKEQVSAPSYSEGIAFLDEMSILSKEILEEAPALKDCLGSEFNQTKAIRLNLPMCVFYQFARFAKREAIAESVDQESHVLGMRLAKLKSGNTVCGTEEVLRNDIANFILERITFMELTTFRNKKPAFLSQDWYDFVRHDPWEGVSKGYLARLFGWADDHPYMSFLSSFLVGFTVTYCALLYYYSDTSTQIHVEDKIANGEPFDTVVKKTVHYAPQAYDGRVKATRLPQLVTKDGKSQDAWTNNLKEFDQINRIRKNIVSVCARAVRLDGTLEPFSIEMHGLFVNSRTLLINEHFYREFQKLSNVRKVVTVTSFDLDGNVILERRINVDDLNSRPVATGPFEMDVRVLTVQDFPGMKDLQHFFSTSEVLEGSVATLLPGHNGQGAVSGTVGERSLCQTVNGQWFTLDLKPTDGITIAGDCGRPWVVVRKSEVRIIGIHASIYDDSILGIACVGRQHFEPDVHIESAVQVKSGKCQLFDQVCVNSVAQTSDFVRTGYTFECAEWVPSAKGYNTLLQNSAKYHERGILDPESIVVNSVKHYWASFVKQPVKRKFDIGMAMNGSDVMRPIVLSTSCGYLKFGGYREGKNELLVRGDDDKLGFTNKAREFVSPLLKRTFVDHLEVCDTLIRNREAFPMLWVSALKDELVSPEKRELRKTRVIEQPGLEYLLLVRMYFGDFLDWYKSHSGTLFKHAIGIDKEVAWKDIACEMLGFAQMGLAFDYSQWDGSVPPWCFDVFESFTHAFYDNNMNDRNARSTLLFMLRCSNLLVGDEVRLTDRGNKSGNPFTDVFNSVCNASVIMVAYLYLRSWNNFGMDPFSFDDHMRILTYGDDVICAVKFRDLKYLNGPAFAELLALFGFTLTDSNKTSDKLALYVPIISSDFTFLKTPFIYDSETSTWLAPLPLKVVFRELTWIPKKMFGNELDKKQRVFNVVHFLAHYPRHVYDECVALMTSQGIVVPYDWKQLRDELHWKQTTGSRGGFR